MVKLVLYSACFSSSLLAFEAIAEQPVLSIELIEYIAEMEPDRGEFLDVMQVKELAQIEKAVMKAGRQEPEKSDEE